MIFLSPDSELISPLTQCLYRRKVCSAFFFRSAWIEREGSIFTLVTVEPKVPPRLDHTNWRRCSSEFDEDARAAIGL
jgi:hypothetical protein